MPWAHLDAPSLAIGVLHARVEDACPDVTVSEYHGDLAWAKYVLDHSDGGLTVADLAAIADSGAQYGIGDWVFASALYDTGDDWRLAEMLAYAEPRDLDTRAARAMRPLAPGFADDAADAVLATNPDVVGFSVTFMQNVASLAVAARIKRRKPGVVVVFGGANCEGPMGHALLRNHRFVDYVVRGEGEMAFPDLLRSLGGDVSHIPGLCRWRGDEAVANDQTPALVPASAFPVPTFDEWFAAFERSPVAASAPPELPLEASRGCWWGQRHHCTFCGLNGTTMTYRRKAPDQMLAEIDELVSRYKVLDITMADNILPVDYFTELFPRLAEREWDLRVYFELKSNLKREQMTALAAAGVYAIQPGIENLSTRVLKIMNKGVTGTGNVSMLRDAQCHGLTVHWNYLYGFPGETPDDYWPVIGQMPALAHLQPPGYVPRLTLERFSPYFNRPELGFGVRRPARFYNFIYDLPESELTDLVYTFDANAVGIGGTVEQALHEAVSNWSAAYPDSVLFMTERGDGALEVHDQRSRWPERRHVLTGWQRDGYRFLRRGRTTAALQRALTEAGHEVGEGAVRDWLAALRVDGLVFADAGDYVALALDQVPPRVRPR